MNIQMSYQMKTKKTLSEHLTRIYMTAHFPALLHAVL